MVKESFVVGAVLGAALSLPAQSTEPAADVVARVHAGGTIEPLRYRRAADGALEVAVPDDNASPRWQPLLGEDLGAGFSAAGLGGLLALFCHGPSDLVGMTDAAFHFDALGIAATDADLRQLLARPMPDGDAAAQRAAMFDRLLAIDVLARRRCAGAAVELRLLQAEGEPAPLRTRAAAALSKLEGRPSPIERQRLAAEELQLPATHDGWIVVHHDRLPDMSWLTPCMRRFTSTMLASMLARFDPQTTTELRHTCQRSVDAVAALPFAVALRYGNARVDHSVLFVGDAPAGRAGGPPLALAWQAAGRFEAERWQQASRPESVGPDMIFSGEMTVDATRVVATLGAGERAADAERAAAMLEDTSAAIRVGAPPKSRLWRALGAFGLPTPARGELQVRFGDAAMLTLSVHANTAEDAAAWVERGQPLLERATEQLRAVAPEGLREHAAFENVLAAIGATAFRRDDDVVTIELSLAGVDDAAITSMLCAAAAGAGGR